MQETCFHLKRLFGKLPELRKLLVDVDANMLKEIYQSMDELTDIYELIDKAIIEEPGITITEGNIIKHGYNEETGIKNLKISYNKVFGYYIEVTKSNLKLVPDRYVRKQTLTNGERFITEELKEIEDTILRLSRKISKFRI